MVTIEKWFLKNGKLPNIKPANKNTTIHATPPIMLYKVYLAKDILPTPATNGATVRMIGINLLRITAAEPCLVKKSSVL